jgi:hypothetical protein
VDDGALYGLPFYPKIYKDLILLRKWQYSKPFIFFLTYQWAQKAKVFVPRLYLIG